jgi:UDP-glucose 4-epimerase
MDNTLCPYSWVMANYLITGGAGFIGSHLAKKLLKMGHSVEIIDDLSKGRIENIPPGAVFHKFDLQRPPDFLGLDRKPLDCIFHLAGQSSGERSFEDPIRDVQSNLISTYNIIQIANQLQVPKIVFASSMSVYGNQKRIPLLESSPTEPLTPYGTHKLASEQALRVFANYSKTSISVCRLFNVYGPGQDLADKSQGMVSIYLSYLLENKPILVKGSLDRVRDFIYIEDVIDALLLVSNSRQGYEVLNICTGIGTRISNLLEMLLLQFPEHQTQIEVVSGTLGDQFEVVGSPELIESKYGWNARVSLNKGLEKLLTD